MWFKVRKTVQVIYPEDVIRLHALRRLATVFRVPESSLSNDARFGQALTAARRPQVPSATVS